MGVRRPGELVLFNSSAAQDAGEHLVPSPPRRSRDLVVPLAEEGLTAEVVAANAEGARPASHLLRPTSLAWMVPCRQRPLGCLSRQTVRKHPRRGDFRRGVEARLYFLYVIPPSPPVIGTSTSVEPQPLKFLCQIEETMVVPAIPDNYQLPAGKRDGLRHPSSFSG